MKAKSHQLLGSYLVQQFLSGAPERYIRAFLLGCVEPDRNPTTYLKGSLRQQWLRGHNWNNAQRYIARISARLERRSTLRTYDYYVLGKLVHYITDAFTYAHNAEFPTDIHSHRDYENRLQAYFCHCISMLSRQEETAVQGRAIEVIRLYHREYMHRPKSVQLDSDYTILVCTTVVPMLLRRKTA